VLEFTDVRMAVPLAAPHEPIDFVVERNNQRIGPIGVKPDYRRPESTRNVRRQAVGISQGFTREIMWLGPGIDPSRPDSPRAGDVLVEADGQPITDENASAMRNMLAYAKEVYVERLDPADPKAPPRRIRVNIPPQLALYPSNTEDQATISLLGLTPLVRFDAIDGDGRARLAGLGVGDTVLIWDDIRYPNSAAITAAARDNPERDIYFKVRKANGDTRDGFVRPKPNRFGAATIQATCEAVPEDDPAAEQARARFVEVRPFGRAFEAGIESGDLILSIAGAERPTADKVKRLVRENGKSGLPILVEKKDGRLLRTVVYAQPPGAIDASFSLVADDWLQVGDIVPTIAGRPSPAAVAGIPPGVRITAVDDHPVSTWRELIARFLDNAGGTVSLSFVDGRGEAVTVSFPVPNSLRTLLGVGPEARIVSVAGRKTVWIEIEGKREEVHVGYQEGLRRLLTELAGEDDVPVEFRRNPLSDVETKHVAVTLDMIDPWVGRIVFAPNVEVAMETKLLRGENALEAVQIGLQKTYYFILQVYQTMQRMFFSRSVGFENLSGPLGIVSIGGTIARAGLVEFLFFLAILSANLAVINFLPLPIVDGGLMVFLIIEKIKGSPVSLRVQVATQMLGLFLIVGVFMFVTYNDWRRMFG
ncbi:MAG: site-2 protease family protein, partial [Planctomycetes bacterium]|nr:site-2 protease family protein [Planctomycetota bacterium]